MEDVPTTEDGRYMEDMPTTEDGRYMEDVPTTEDGRYMEDVPTTEHEVKVRMIRLLDKFRCHNKKSNSTK